MSLSLLQCSGISQLQIECSTDKNTNFQQNCVFGHNLCSFTVMCK